MAAQDLALKVLLQVDSSQSSKISGFGSILGELKNPANLLKTGILAAGAAVVGFAAASVDMAAKYQQSMNMVQALTDSSKTQMDQYDQGLKALAIDSGVGPTKLSQGLYYVISAGYQGADALNMLSLATKDAVIGLTDSKITSMALTTVMQGFNEKTKDMVKVNGEMLRATSLGRMSMQDYAGAISKVATLHAQYKVTLEDTNATLATLTYGGYKSATVAATAYGQLVSIMDGKTDLMTKRIDKMLGTTTGYVKVLKDVHGQMTMVTVKVTEHNKAFNEAYFKTLDYSHQLQYLNNVMKGHYDQLQNVLGGSKQAASAFTTLMTHSKMFADDLKELSNQQKNAAATQEKWAITQSGFSQTMARAGAAVQVLMITVGQALLPILTKLGQQLLPLITSFTTWLQKSGALQLVGSLLAGAFQLVFNVIGNILSVAGAIIGFFQQNEVAGALLIGTLTAIAAIIAVSVIPGLIVAGLTAVATFIAWAAAAAVAAIATIAATWPIILIGVIIAAVVAGIILAIQHWGQIMDWISGKAAITADKVALAHIKMRLSADDNQKKQAEKSLSNLQKEHASILAKLKQAHSEQERETLMHQLRMVDAQIDGQNKRIAAIDADKQKQIEKQKELQDKLQEDQKNWFVRLLDDILGFFGMVFGAIGGFFGNIFSKIGQFKDAVIQKFRDIWNGIVDGAKSILNGLGTTIVNLVKIPVNLVIGGINHLIDGYNNLPKLGAPNLGHIPLLASGAENFQGGMAYVHAGEVLTYLPRGASVTPAHRVSAALRAGGGAGGSGAYIHNGDIIINAPNANADEVARKVEAILDRKLRRSGSITTTTSGGRAAS